MVRIFGIDAPERNDRCYRRATNTLRQLAGKAVRVEPGPRERDPGGRLLYYTFTVAGNSIDEMLVREGLARAWNGDGQHREVLMGWERGARNAAAGCLW
jgi:endonuclease YncB( thermonuclease family)